MKPAPFQCPRCRAEKEWICLNDPAKGLYFDRDRFDLLVHFFRPGDLEFFERVSDAIRNHKPLKYQCQKCGFKKRYKAD